MQIHGNKVSFLIGSWEVHVSVNEDNLLMLILIFFRILHSADVGDMAAVPKVRAEGSMFFRNVCCLTHNNLVYQPKNRN
jgi:hypothetical protein